MQKGETLFYAFLFLIPIIGTWIYLRIVDNKKKKKKSDSLGQAEIGSAHTEDQNKCHSVADQYKNLSRRKISSMEDTASFSFHSHVNRLGAASRGDEMGTESIECVEKDSALGGSAGNHVRDNLSNAECEEERESHTKRCGEGATEEKCQMNGAPMGESSTGEGSLERICQYSEREKSEVGGATEGEMSRGRGSESTMESLPGISYAKAHPGNQTTDSYNDKAKKKETDEISEKDRETNEVNTHESQPNNVNTNENDKRESFELDSQEDPSCTFAKQPNGRTKTEDMKEQLNKEDTNDRVRKDTNAHVRKDTNGHVRKDTNDNMRKDTNDNVRNYYSDNCISKDHYQDSSSHLSSSVEDEESEDISSNEGDSDRSEDSADGRSSSVLSEDYDDEEEEDDGDDEDDEGDEDDEDGENYADGNCLDDQNTEEIKYQGNELFKKGDYKQAIFYYNKALIKCKEKSTKSILYSNRAACYSHLGNWNQVVEDCNKSINYNESFVKSYLRRSNAYEQLQKYNDASNDLNKAISLDSSLLANYEMKQKKLKYLAEQQLNKEKEEMVGKLKDFGNLLLGKVGLSLDNFEVQKNPNNDGSFNIQFKQNK
ncbi:hypothetical protein C922_03590 [Plasmodium inui San Antonio 1]|uniref:Uncharacterized protein n=1 Tax=Plasmodium inui San Antonio 1 TaxID=1237626 RepID=W7A388_9APIC|nr:hypothetical protein C922_03590 [Plasmodium inui San Antonio 1]EUD66120.1 hypothetical protein C922_03590 [Plasmodium inui San Antonio 1]